MPFSIAKEQVLALTGRGSLAGAQIEGVAPDGTIILSSGRMFVRIIENETSTGYIAEISDGSINSTF